MLQTNADDSDPKSRGEDHAKEKEREDEEEAHEKSAPGAHVVYKAISLEAEEELQRPAMGLAWSGFAAGMSMGASLTMEGLIKARLPDVAWTDLVVKIGYTFGFVMVIMGRQQLFTENTLTPMLPLLKRKDWTTFKQVMRLWGIVLAANLVGAIALTVVLARTQAFNDHEREAFLHISLEAMKPTVGTLFVKSILAGGLIALMVWMLPAAEGSRIWIVIMIPYVVGLGGLSHIIVGTVYCAFTVVTHHHTWWEYVSHFFWPVLLGNIVGGVGLVALVNHGQVQPEE